MTGGWIGGGCARGRGAEGRARGARRRRAAPRLGAAGRASGSTRRDAGRKPRGRALRPQHVPEPGHHGYLRRAGAAASRAGDLRREPGRRGAAQLARQLGFRSRSRARRRTTARPSGRGIEGYALGRARPGAALHRRLDPGQGRRGGPYAPRWRRRPTTRAFVGSRRKMAALREKCSRHRASTRRARPRQGAGRARSRRHHAGGNRAFDPRRDHRPSTPRPALVRTTDKISKTRKCR